MVEAVIRPGDAWTAMAVVFALGATATLAASGIAWLASRAWRGRPGAKDRGGDGTR